MSEGVAASGRSSVPHPSAALKDGAPVQSLSMSSGLLLGGIRSYIAGGVSGCRLNLITEAIPGVHTLDCIVPLCAWLTEINTLIVVRGK